GTSHDAGDGGLGAPQTKTPGEKASGPVSADGSGWTRASCPCCAGGPVEPLVLLQLRAGLPRETKDWVITLIATAVKQGGAGLSAHPGEEPSGDIIVVSAPRCTLLRAAEELGLCKPYRTGDMTAFSYHDRSNFRDADDVQVFLTLAERQYIVKYELEGLRAQRDLKIPGLPEGRLLQRRDNIWQKLKAVGVVQGMFPLNDEDKLKALSDCWYSGNQLTQPLDKIHAYFGGTVAFYFSFLEFYTWSLLPPAILGLILTVFSGSVNKEAMDSISDSKVAAGDDDDDQTVSGHMIQAVFSMLWSTVVIEMWKRRSTLLAYRWGTMQLAERFSEPRPAYHGALGVNPVTGRVEPLFPAWQRELRMALVSVPAVGLFLGLVVMGMLGFYWGEAQAQSLHAEWDSLLSSVVLYLPSVAHIVYTNALGTAYRQVALALTEFENHREESAYNDHLTGKILVFTFFNYFAVLFHIAFYKQDLPLLRKRLASLLIITQLVNQVTEVVIPFLVDRFLSAPKRKEKKEDPQEDKFRNQSSLPDFPGLFSEYIELLVQFGYFSLFSCVYPLTAVLLLVNNLTEIRSDAYKMCKLFKKPFSAPVAGMGVWQTAFEVLSFVSVISNCWLLLLSPRLQELGQESGVTGTNVVLVAVLMEHLLIMIKMVLAKLIPDEPDWIRVKREQNEFISMQALGQQVNTHSLTHSHTSLYY
uniref:Anoctamin n=1 Tax=Gadus morhua TaxID=8049 RepID=A0A8C4Z0U7_GADMO